MCKLILKAGLAGGAAEIAWIAIYSGASDTSGVEVARQVTASLFPAAASLAAAPLIGIAIHLALSVALGAAFGWVAWRYLAPRFGANALWPAALGTLAAVWAVNFFIVLPILNPAFVKLIPYAVTLASKLLFGITMAATLTRSAVR